MGVSLHHHGNSTRALVSSAFSTARSSRSGSGQLAGCHPDLADDYSDAAEDRLQRFTPCERTLAWCRRTLFVNWAIKPFSMAFLAWLFIRTLFADWLPADQIDSYIAGLILLAAAPCTAMVFVWSNLSDGEPHFTLTQVALNDTIMVFAFAPLVGLLLGLSAITVPWGYAVSLRCALHRDSGCGGSTLAVLVIKVGWGIRPAAYSGFSRSHLADGAACNADPAIVVTIGGN